MKILPIILLLSSVCFGDVFTSHLKPTTDSTLDIGSAALLWRYIYGDAFTDGIALWEDNCLSGFSDISGTTITGDTLTDGTFIISGGVVSAGTWEGTAIDISDYTNLIAGTNITLSEDTLNVDDAFVVNDASDTTTGTLTAAGFTTTGTTNTTVLIVGSDAPANSTSTGTAGTITWDSDYLYICVAANTWERVAIATWGVADETMIYEDSNTMLYEDGNTMIYD